MKIRIFRYLTAAGQLRTKVTIIITQCYNYEGSYLRLPVRVGRTNSKLRHNFLRRATELKIWIPIEHGLKFMEFFSDCKNFHFS